MNRGFRSMTPKRVGSAKKRILAGNPKPVQIDP